MTGCAFSSGSMASSFAAGGRFSLDCVLICMGGVSRIAALVSLGREACEERVNV